MADKFQRWSSSLEGPQANAFAVTLSDAADVAFTTRAVQVGTGGNLVVTFAGDTSPVTLKNIANGAVLPFRIRRFHATGTTAADIVGLY